MTDVNQLDVAMDLFITSMSEMDVMQAQTHCIDELGIVHDSEVYWQFKQRSANWFAEHISLFQ